MDNELFAGRSVDENTRILSTKYFQHGCYDLLLEEWVWDGIKGKSLILLSAQTTALDELQLENLARGILDLPVEAKTTLKRSEDYVCFNYDFRS
jgi:hypothetical protein